MGLDIVDSGRDGLLDAHSVQETGVAHRAFLGIEARLGNVAAFDQGHNREIESLGEGVVAAVVGRNRHDGAGAVAGQYVFGNPDGYLVAGQRIDRIGAGEDAGHLARFGDAFAFGLFLGLQQIGLDGRFLRRRGELLHPFALRGQHHEGDAEDRVGAGGEDGHVVLLRTVGHAEDHLGTLALADPVALHLLEGVGPVELVQAGEQALGIGAHAQLPLLHLLLFHGETAADGIAFLHLVVGQDGPQLRAPVHGGFAQVGDAVLHQQVGLFLLGELVPTAFGLEFGNQRVDGFCLVRLRIVPMVEHFEEGPLRPLVIGRIAGADLARPVVGEADAVHLLPVARDVLLGGPGRVLAGLDGILLGREAEGVVAHGVQHIEAFQAFVAAVDVTGDIAERMADVQARAGRVREHVQHVIFGFGRVCLGLESVMGGPIGLPFLLDLGEIVFHCVSF